MNIITELEAAIFLKRKDRKAEINEKEKKIAPICKT